MYRIGNVLEHRLAQIYEIRSNRSADQLPDLRRDAYVAGARETLDPCHQVHGMAVDVVGLNNDVTETDGHAQIHTAALLHAGISHHHGLLQSATHGVDGTAEFYESAIAGVFDDAT